jgi:hypothetical protein
MKYDHDGRPGGFTATQTGGQPLHSRRQRHSSTICLLIVFLISGIEPAFRSAASVSRARSFTMKHIESLFLHGEMS